MSFDSLTLYIITQELRQVVLGGNIRHIEQVNPTTFSFKIGQGTKTKWMTVSADARHARIHLIEKPPKGQKQSFFANFLSTHLKHGTITEIAQLGRDRILKMTIQPKSDELIQPSPKAIVVEMMGKHSNIILIDSNDDTILECLKHVDKTMSRYREVLPGETYTFPPQQDKLDPLKIDKSTFSNLFNTSHITWKDLFNNIDGLSPTLAKEIIERTQKMDLWDAFQQIISYYESTQAAPQIILDGQHPIAVAPMSLMQFTDITMQPYNSMSEALTIYYDTITLNEKKLAEKQKLKNSIQKQKSFLQKKEKELQNDLKRAEKSDEFRIQGELILVNIQKIKRGQNQVELQNYYSTDLETINIQLDPEISPSDNAQIYFKKYTKAKRGFSQIKHRLAELETEKKIINNYDSKVESADTLEKLQQLHAEFIDNGYLKSQYRGKQKQDITDGPFRKYTSKNGFQIYVGRNSESNDMLLRQIAKPRDMWLHAKQINGSHVIIRNPENRSDIPMPTLLQAAQLAAYFSKAHHSSYVPVDYTWARYVVKRKGNVAGYVHYTHEKTLYVEPAVPL